MSEPGVSDADVSGPGADPDVSAAELALGLLEGDARATALRRVLADPAWAAEVEGWRTALAPLHEGAPALAPNTALFGRIEASLAPPALSPSYPVRRRRWPALGALTGIAAALVLGVVLTRPPVSIPPAPPTVPPALLAAAVVPTARAAAAGPALSAVYEPGTGALRLTAASLADADHAAELWVIGGDGVPHSLGVLQGSGPFTLAVAAPNRSRLVTAATLAVTVEPPGGAPDGRPTGPVVAKGVLART